MTDGSNRNELFQLANLYGGSTRLRNSLRVAQNDGLLEGISVQDVLRNDAKVISLLRDIPNFGAKCLAELRDLAKRVFPDEAYGPISTVADSNADSPPLESTQNAVTIVSEPTISCPTEALRILSENAEQIIRMRLGLDGEEPKTLALIGSFKGVTRERIRQIEVKSIGKLKRSFRNSFSRLLQHDQTLILSRLATHQVIRYCEETQLFLALDADSRLMITVVYGSVQAWLDETCKRSKNGWLLPSISIDAFDHAQGWLNERLTSVQLPCLLASIFLTQGAPPEEALRAVFALSPNLSVSGDYLLRRYSGRARRAVRCHELMRQRGGYNSISVAALRDIYWRSFQDDQCSSRDIVIVLSDNSHLFLNQYEAGWCAIGPSNLNRTPLKFVEYPLEGVVEGSSDEEDERAATDDETLRGVLAQILLEHGPQSFNDLRRLFVDRVGSKYSRASVGPTLLMYDDFVRIGPGIYAHRQHLQDQAIIENASNRLLLNKTQLEIFCRATWAGELPSSYILWSSHMQVRWADWALHTNQKQLLSSLLAVCDIESWPIKTGDRIRWARLKDRASVYLLEEQPLPLSAKYPSFREFFSAAALAVNAGRISWMSINRASGCRVDDRHSVSCLALLIAAGIVEPAMHWQQEHVSTGSHATGIVDSLMSMVWRDATTHWTKSILMSCRNNYESLLEPGWTVDQGVSSLLDRLSQAVALDEVQGMGGVPQLDEYELLKKQLKDELSLDRLRDRVK